MVAKQTLPGCAGLFFTNIVFILLRLHRVSSSSLIQYCWSGVEDDNTNWRNLSCMTNLSTMPNSIATKTLAHGTSPDAPGGSYYCMAFKYNETTVDAAGVATVKLNAFYSCDTQSTCAGRSMLEGYKFYSSLRNVDGVLYCCDSGNNCNTHQLLYKRRHQHTCYTGESDIQSLRIDHCPQQKAHCVKTSTKKIMPNTDVETVKETYRCDINNEVCTNLTEAQNHSCKETMTRVNNITIETQVCCCKSDNCYKPSWAEGDVSGSVRNNNLIQNGWQRTMLIIIGVALGILVVGVTLLFIRKSVVNSKKTESPGKQYMKTTYKNVSMQNTDTDDTVQILTA